MHVLHHRIWAASLGAALLALGPLATARAETFSDTNASGTWRDYTVPIDSGVTNVVWSVTGQPGAYSHLLLKAGATPSLTDYDVAARIDGQSNVLALELPDLLPTNYIVRVYTPPASAAHAFTLTVARDQAGTRSAAQPAAKPIGSLTEGRIPPGGWHYFQVAVGAGLPGWIIHLNSSNSVDLYVRRGALPTLSNADRLSVGRPVDTIFFSDAELAAGMYYVGVHVPATAAQDGDYVLQTAPGALTTLGWDPGMAPGGTQVFTSPSPGAGDYFFKITAQSSAVGAWRTALEVTAGEAGVYLSRGLLPAPPLHQFASENPGSDGFVLHPEEFAAGEEWFLLVRATAGAQWRLWSGDVYVQDLGALAAGGGSGSGAVTIGPEGMRFFKTTVPVDTLAWRLSLNDATNLVLVKKNAVPHPWDAYYTHGYDLRALGHMLVVPDYLVPGTDLYFVGVVGAPGTVITLDSRQQPITELAFNATTSLTTTGEGYATFRVRVPVEQVGWQVTVTPTSGEANLAVRRNLVPNEWRNDALSEAPGTVADSIALGPPVLSDGVFYLTVYGSASYSCTVASGDAQVTDIHYTDVRVNDEPHRVGWKFYRVANLQEQSGTLGWELLLANAPPGTEIALRRNAIPYRRNFRSGEDGYLQVQGDVDAASDDGFLQHPAHQADVWYVGVYSPTNELGNFTLTSRELTVTSLALNNGVESRSDVPSDRWQFFRVDVPAAVAGWDVRLVNVTRGQPRLVVRRGQLPISLDTCRGDGGPWYSPMSGTTWPVGYQWAPHGDWTGYPFSPEGASADGHIFAVGLGNPLEPGTYFVGVRADTAEPLSYAIESRAIGDGQALPLHDLAFAGGSRTHLALPARTAAYYRITVPANTPSWHIRLQVTRGEALCVVQKTAIPSFEQYGDTVLQFSGGFRLQSVGNEHFLLLPENGQTLVPAGTYYVAVVSEGENPDPSQGLIGDGDGDYVLTSLGALPVVALGDTGLGTAELVLPDALEGGEIKAYQFQVPTWTPAVELELTGRTGNPVLAVRPGTQVPQAAQIWMSLFDGYGSQGGSADQRTEHSERITLANASGVYTLVVKANVAGGASGASGDATYSLRVRSLDAEALVFDAGTRAVADQAPGTWRYFRVEVPPQALGWDLRLADVTQGVPRLVVRRAQLPDEVLTSSGGNWPEWYYGPRPATNWPSGYQIAPDWDWTRRAYSANDSVDVSGRTLTLSRGNPLEPGTYYVGVYVMATTSAPEPATYTLVSRGIGATFALPVDELGYTGGTVTNRALAAREVAYYHVVVPPGATSWQVKLTALTGEALLAVQHDALPNMEADPSGNLGLAQCMGGRRVAKTGNEHFLLLPPNGTNTIPPGDYYVAVVSEGEGVDWNRTGAGGSDCQLTSIGPIPVDALGVVSATEVVRSTLLEGGEAKAYQFTVPAGASSVEIRLTGITGRPYLVARPGEALPYREYYDPATRLDPYGVDGGQTAGRQEDAELVTVANPAPGTYSVLVKNLSLNGWNDSFEDGGYTLSVRASSTTELAFDGGSLAIAGQGPGSWNFYRVEVPPDALGWDVRLTEVIGGRPRLAIRRDALPESAETPSWSWRSVFSFTNWPTGNYLSSEYDWTRRSYGAVGNADERWRILALGMGNPLEPGVYFVGVFNDDPAPTSYHLTSRGIGDGRALPIVDLPFTGGSAAHTGLAPREAAYYRVTVPEGAPSWNVTLEVTSGEALLAIQQQTPASSAVGGYSDSTVRYGVEGWAPGGLKLQKAGDEHFVLLPEEGQTVIPAGTYYLSVVSEGINPEDDYHIGSGSSRFVLRSVGEMPKQLLGDVGATPLTHSNLLAGGALALYEFRVPAGTLAVEVRLADRQGNPVLGLRAGDAVGFHYDYWGFRLLGWYGVDGGYSSGLLGDPVTLTLPNPVPGNYQLVVKSKATDDERTFPDAGYRLQVRSVPAPQLAFTRELAAAGLTNAASAVLADNQRAFYRVVVPADVAGQPVLGWKLDLLTTQGRASVRVRPGALPADGNSASTEFTPSSAVLVPSYLNPGEWWVEVKAEGTTEFTLVSSALALERPAWVMPAPGQPVGTPGLVAPEFGDSGVDAAGQLLPGDHGLYLEDGKHHFYAIVVPTNNVGLVRVTLETISGNPDLYARVGAAPTLTRLAAGGYYGEEMVHRALTGSTTEYGAWVPASGRRENRLTPGVWYLMVRANGNSNARYRLRLSLGDIQELAIHGGSLTGQQLTAGDWRYYRLAVPADAPATWNVTFSQQSGDVVLSVRDTVPPGDSAPGDWYVRARDWAYDAKNQGPYSEQMTPGTQTFSLPPVRPGCVYYLGFRARSDAIFSVSSTTSGAPLSALAVNFYGGTLDLTLPALGTALCRVDVPADAIRWRHTSAHDAAVQVYLEQGSVPRLDQQHWRSYYENSELNRYLGDPSNWPWLPSQSYFLLLTNTSATPQAFHLALQGRTLATDDEDADGVPDAWEMEHFGSWWWYDGNADPDNDGLTNTQEYQLHSNPRNGNTRGLLSQMRLLTGGRVQMQFTGETGLRYEIEVSTNLVNWTVVQTLVPTNDTGILELQDTTTNRVRRFYRSRVIQSQ